MGVAKAAFEEGVARIDMYDEAYKTYLRCMMYGYPDEEADQWKTKNI